MRIYAKSLSVIFSAALPSCNHTAVVHRAPVSAAPRPGSSLSTQIFNEINSYRSDCGKSALQRHPGLDRLAQEHSEYMRKYRGTFSISGSDVSHFGFENRAINARERFQMTVTSENVAAARYSGRTAAPALVKLWLDSRHHVANIRNSWTYTGVGTVVDSDGMIFVTQLFACQTSSQRTTYRRFNGGGF